MPERERERERERGGGHMSSESAHPRNTEDASI